MRYEVMPSTFGQQAFRLFVGAVDVGRVLQRRDDVRHRDKRPEILNVYHVASLAKPRGLLASMRMGSARDYRLRVRVIGV